MNLLTLKLQVTHYPCHIYCKPGVGVWYALTETAQSVKFQSSHWFDTQWLVKSTGPKIDLGVNTMLPGLLLYYCEYP